MPVATPTPAPTSTPTPAKVAVAGARFESGSIEGSHITVLQGSEVDVYVTLESTAPTEGQLEVLVLRDIILDEDQGKKLCTSPVILSAGSQEVLGCDFLADDLITGTLRQYYIQVSWNNALIYNPTDPNTREFVLTEPAPVAVPTATPIPSSGKIAFWSDRDDNNEIYSMNANGSNQTRLTFNSADDWVPS